MEDNELKKVFAERLIELRKNKGLTQSQLGEVLNYSDKSISKWERAEALPDVLTICALAEYFEVPTNYFLSNAKEIKIVKQSKTKKHVIISILSSGVVWLLATICFFALTLATNLDHLWLTFIVAIPITFIVLTTFSALWFKYVIQCLSVSMLVWSICLTMFLLISLTGTPNTWLIFTIGAVLQVLAVLWFVLVYERTKEKKPKEEEKNTQKEKTED